MAESLGEAFVEILADTSPFGDSLESGVADAMAEVESSVSEVFGNVPGIAEEAFDETVSSADDAADEIGSSFERLQSAVSENLGKIALGGAVAGAALEGFARKERDATVDARFLARQLGITDSQMLDLIAATSDATLPLEDVTELMRTAAQRGVEGEQPLVDFAKFWDMIGDATGESATSLAVAGVALAQIGIGAGEEAGALDSFGFVMNNTSSTVGGFLKLLKKVGGDFGDSAPPVNDLAAALAAMEEQGIDARLGTGLLGAALKETDGDLGAALETLGVSADAFGRHADLVEGSGQAIRDNADIFADARTPVENMTAAVRAQLFRFPELGEAAGALAGPLTALGPAAVGFTHGVTAVQMVSKGMPKALGAMRVAFVKLGAVILANPIFLIGALLIGLAILVYKFREEIIDALVGAWEFVKDKVGGLLEWFGSAIPDAIAAVVQWVKDNWPLILAIITGPIGLAVKFIVDNWDKIRDTIRGAVDAVKGFISRGFEAVRRTVTNVISRIRDFVVDGFNTLRDRGTSAVERLRDSVRDILNNVVNFVKDLPGRVIRGIGNLGSLLFGTGRDMIQGLLDGAVSLLKNIGKFLLDRIPNWIRSPFEKALGISSPSKVFAEIGRDTIAGFGVGIQDEFRSVQRMLGGIGADIPLAVTPTMGAGFDSISGGAGRGSGGGASVSVTINNPTPEPASQSASRELRKLAAIGVFGE